MSFLLNVKEIILALVLHFLKARNGDARMSFFKAKFEQMKIEEMETPGQQERR